MHPKSPIINVWSTPQSKPTRVCPLPHFEAVWTPIWTTAHAACPLIYHEEAARLNQVLCCSNTSPRTRQSRPHLSSLILLPRRHRTMWCRLALVSVPGIRSLCDAAVQHSRSASRSPGLISGPQCWRTHSARKAHHLGRLP